MLGGLKKLETLTIRYRLLGGGIWCVGHEKLRVDAIFSPGITLHVLIHEAWLVAGSTTIFGLALVPALFN